MRQVLAAFILASIISITWILLAGGFKAAGLAIWYWFRYRNDSAISLVLLKQEGYIPRTVISGEDAAGIGCLTTIVGFALAGVFAWAGMSMISEIAVGIALLGLLPGAAKEIVFRTPPDDDKTIARLRRQAIDRLNAAIEAEGSNATELSLYRRYWRACHVFDGLFVYATRSEHAKPLRESDVQKVRNDLNGIRSSSIVPTPLLSKCHTLEQALAHLVKVHARDVSKNQSKQQVVKEDPSEE